MLKTAKILIYLLPVFMLMHSFPASAAGEAFEFTVINNQPLSFGSFTLADKITDHSITIDPTTCLGIYSDPGLTALTPAVCGQYRLEYDPAPTPGTTLDVMVTGAVIEQDSGPSELDISDFETVVTDEGDGVYILNVGATLTTSHSKIYYGGPYSAQLNILIDFDL